MIETLLLLSRKFLLISNENSIINIRKEGRFLPKQGHLESLSFKGQAIKHKTVNWSIVHNSSAKN